MARASAFVAGMVCGLVLGTAVIVSHADPASANVQAAADEAHVDVQDLLGAMATTGIGDPFTYLRGVDELPPLVVVRAPIPPPMEKTAARVACIESKETGGANVWNRNGSGAGGVLQYMPGTFAAHAREMGHPEWNLWNPDQARAVAAHDLALGRRGQWTVGGC